MQRIRFVVQAFVGTWGAWVISVILGSSSFAQSQAQPLALQAQKLVEDYLTGNSYSGIDANGSPCDVKIYKSTADLWVVIQAGKKLQEEYLFRYHEGRDPLTVTEKLTHRARLRVQSSRKNYSEVVLVSMASGQVEVTVSERAGSVQASKSCEVTP
ncbi:MAG: hypothetical protein JNL01_02830 [Bdellovibrionales bacterium]|nr:hypothetical protein [Bdellovibrionales bacterium]